MKKLGIYSGECLIGIVGEETEITDYKGDMLHIGDIVYVSYNEVSGAVHSGYLSAIVNDKYRTYQDGKIEENKEFNNFVMGIAKVTKSELAYENEDGELLSGWVIEKVKDYSDVIDGEHWKSYGFNYRYIKDN